MDVIVAPWLEVDSPRAKFMSLATAGPKGLPSFAHTAQAKPQPPDVGHGPVPDDRIPICCYLI